MFQTEILKKDQSNTFWKHKGPKQYFLNLMYQNETKVKLDRPNVTLRK